MSNKGVCRTTSSTPGLLNIHTSGRMIKIRNITIGRDGDVRVDRVGASGVDSLGAGHPHQRHSRDSGGGWRGGGG